MLSSRRWRLRSRCGSRLIRRSFAPGSQLVRRWRFWRTRSRRTSPRIRRRTVSPPISGIARRSTAQVGDGLQCAHQAGRWLVRCHAAAWFPGSRMPRLRPARAEARLNCGCGLRQRQGARRGEVARMSFVFAIDDEPREAQRGRSRPAFGLSGGVAPASTTLSQVERDRGSSGCGSAVRLARPAPTGHSHGARRA